MQPITIMCKPGHVYLGGLAGPEHQVHHQLPLPGEVLCGSGVATGRGRDPGLSLTVMCRTALFAHDRARFRNVTPSPQAFFYAISASFRESFASFPLRIPSLRECLRAEGGVDDATKAEVASGSSDAKRRRV